MPKIIRLDSQMLSSFSHCPLRCYFGFIERLQPVGENKHFAMGSVIHVGLEEYYKGIKNGTELKDNHINSILSANNYAVTQTQLDKNNIDTCMKTLDEYIKYRRDDRIEVKAVEVPFSFVLYEGPDLRGNDIKVLDEGKIDLIVRFVGDEEDSVLDHKTTSRNFEPVDMRVQFLNYTLATGCQVTMNRVGFQESLAPSQKFKRFPFKFEPAVIENFRRFAIQKSLEYAYYLEEGNFPPNFGSCEGSFYPCTFINLCRWPQIAKETKKFEFAIGEVWDVFKEKNT